MLETKRPMVSIIIKAFNEESHIAGAVESALAALDGLDGEVILADGASTDRTIAIAQNYPVKIVRLDNVEDRSCGAGAQLGYQYSSGEFLCLMDGDMRLRAGFLEAGMRFLNDHPDCGGVGGTIVDRGIENLEYEQREKRFDPDRRPGPVSRLHCSGLYRRTAIESVGYVTDRNLHAGEEIDLAARLHARGWTLSRIDCHAIDHYVHGGNAYRLLFRRLTSRFSCGPGEVVRASIGRAHFRYLIRHDRNVLLCGLVGLWLLSIALLVLLGRGPRPAIATAVAALAIFPFVLMSLRWRSVRNGIYSVVVWIAHAFCFLPGFLRPRISPTEWLESTVVKNVPCGEARTPRRQDQSPDKIAVARPAA